MNIVIAGAGAVGTHLAKMLSRQEHNIMLIDTNQDKLEDLESQIDILSIVGSCTSIGALKDAEVGKCDLYIAVNPQEDQNINSAILAKKLGAKRTISRVNNSEYLEIENAEYLRSIGIDSLIYPERLAAEEIVASLKQIGSRQMHEFSDGRLQLLGIKLWDNALILNHTLIKMAEIYGADQFRIVAIKRHNHTIIPRGNDELKYGDLVFIVTRPSFISNVFALCGKEQFEIKNIVIVGASRIGIKTASLLEKNYHVKIIEKYREKCIQLADKLKSTLVINGDGRDLTLLREEGIKNVDAFISLTGSSETNILSCLLAKKMGVKKSVAEVENIDYIDLAENIGIGTLINTKLIAASHIYRYTMNVDVRHLKFLTFSEAEVFELEAQPGSMQTFVFMPASGLTQGAMPLMGYNYGAGYHQRLHEALKYAISVTGIIMLCGCLLFEIFPTQLLGLFDANAEMMNIGVPALRIIGISFIPATFGFILPTLFQAMGLGLQSLIIFLLRQLIITLPLAFLFANWFGLYGIWVCFILAETTAAIVAYLLYLRIRKTDPILSRNWEAA